MLSKVEQESFIKFIDMTYDSVSKFIDDRKKIKEYKPIQVISSCDCKCKLCSDGEHCKTECLVVKN